MDTLSRQNIENVLQSLRESLEEFEQKDLGTHFLAQTNEQSKIGFVSSYDKGLGDGIKLAKLIIQRRGRLILDKNRGLGNG